jgi:8-oxo-dGTP diphosphatase
MHTEISLLLNELVPHDLLEQTHLEFTKNWVESGIGLFRIEKPATPSPHLVSYFLLTDLTTNEVLLVDHRKALCWLPTGGHVEPGEHPRTTVERECLEELGIEATFLFESPLFLTVTETGGLTPGHTDVSLWYILTGDSSAKLQFDREEFADVRWFRPDEIPYKRADPHLLRCLQKLEKARLNTNHYHICSCA